MAALERIRVELICALPGEQRLLTLELDAGATVMAAIEASGLRTRLAQAGFTERRVGIFGRLVSLDTLLRDGDRVELYRPLQADPKEARRARVVKARREASRR